MSTAIASICMDFQPAGKAFYEVGGAYPERMEVVSEIFHRILTPLYGSQEKAIGQIRDSSDRKCFLLYEKDFPVGVLAFKTVLSDEFAEFGVSDSIEVKSLFVDQSAQNSGRGLGSALVDKLKEEVHKLALGHKGIHVTVSETKEESLLFFKGKGFKIAFAWKDKYIVGVTEYLLHYPTKTVEVERIIALSGRLPSIAAASAESSPELVHIIHNAHSDDIHALKKLSDGTFISGSKDNCLYKWNFMGESIRIVDEPEPTHQTERNWITAVEIINDAYWVSGERSGRLSLWKTNGDYVRDFKLNLPGVGHRSHQFNARRINCFATGLDKDHPSFFIGFPTMFDEFNFIEGETEFSTVVHKNDWVYSIQPLDSHHLLTVTGCVVNLWEKGVAGWCHQDTIISEEMTPKSRGYPKSQRPFISSLIPLLPGKDHFAISAFDGSVKVFDPRTKEITFVGREHANKVWFLENIGHGLFASCGQDRSIKFWDTRSGVKSVHTISDHIGEVTTMLSLNETSLIAGTCPSGALKAGMGAEIRFYDIRRFGAKK